MLTKMQKMWHWVFTGKEFRFADAQFPFGVVRYVHDSTENLPMHRHGFIEMVFVLEGKAEHLIRLPKQDEFVCEISKGDVFIINPDEEHTFRIEPGMKLDILNVNFHSSFLDGTFVLGNDEVRVMDFVYQQPLLPLNVRFGKILKLDDDEQKHMVTQIDGICKEIKEKRIGYHVVIGLVMAQVFAMLSRKYVEAVESGLVLDKDGAGGMTNIFRVMGFIEHHYNEDVSKEELARIGICSVRQLSRKFKECTGETVVEYVHRLRIDRARRLLSETDMKITEIASVIGFNDISFFNRVFKQQLTMTPREYREHYPRRMPEMAAKA